MGADDRNPPDLKGHIVICNRTRDERKNERGQSTREGTKRKGRTGRGIPYFYPPRA